MRLNGTRVVAVLLSLLGATALHAQQAPSSTVTTVPRLVRVTSTYVPADGLPPALVETVTLAIYTEATGGTPIWWETQTVMVDADGRYSVLLGATLPDGLPLELFASGEARWLGRRFERPGEGEHPRIPLTSVPYALKASDADTLGGRPPSAYLLAEPSEGGGTAAITSAGASAKSTTASALPLSAGTVNYLGKFVNASDLGNSALYDTGGFVGINTTTPFDILHTRFTNTNGAITGYAVQNLGNTATSYSGMLFYDQNGALGQFQGFNNVTHEYRINNIASGGSINFMLGGSSKFRVRPDGDVEILGNLRKGGSPFLISAGINTSLGVSAGNVTMTGLANTASGAFALNSNTSGNENTASGYDALLSNTMGGANTASGGHALQNNTTGFNNVAVGDSAGVNATTGSNNIYLGAQVLGVAGEANTMYLGKQGTQTTTFIAGVRGITTGVADAISVVIDSNGQLGTVNSSRRYKEDIHDMADASERIFKLHPVTFRYTKAYANGSKPIQFGLVAEEVAEVFPELAVYNADGGVDTVHYETLNMLLLNEMQKQQERIEALEQQVKALLSRLAPEVVR